MRLAYMSMAAVVLTACGNGGGSSQASISTARIQKEIAAVTAAAAKHDYAGARSSLVVLLNDISAVQQAGTLPTSHIVALRASATVVELDLAALTAVSSAAPTASPASTASTASTASRAPNPPVTPAAAPTSKKHKPKPDHKSESGSDSDSD